MKKDHLKENLSAIAYSMLFFAVVAFIATILRAVILFFSHQVIPWAVLFENYLWSLPGALIFLLLYGGVHYLISKIRHSRHHS